MLTGPVHTQVCEQRLGWARHRRRHMVDADVEDYVALRGLGRAQVL